MYVAFFTIVVVVVVDVWLMGYRTLPSRGKGPVLVGLELLLMLMVTVVMEI